MKVGSLSCVREEEATWEVVEAHLVDLMVLPSSDSSSCTLGGVEGGIRSSTLRELLSSPSRRPMTDFNDRVALPHSCARVALKKDCVSSITISGSADKVE